jgi:hypothetical protein
VTFERVGGQRVTVMIFTRCITKDVLFIKSEMNNLKDDEKLLYFVFVSSSGSEYLCCHEFRVVVQRTNASSACIE